jgi:hypothetical protein
MYHLLNNREGMNEVLRVLEDYLIDANSNE